MRSQLGLLALLVMGCRVEDPPEQEETSCVIPQLISGGQTVFLSEFGPGPGQSDCDNYTLAGEVRIEDGGTLQIGANVQVVVGLDAVVIVGENGPGRLSIEGESGAGYVHFTGDQWEGFRFGPQTTDSEIRNARIEDADIAVQVSPFVASEQLVLADLVIESASSGIIAGNDGVLMLGSMDIDAEEACIEAGPNVAGAQPLSLAEACRSGERIILADSDDSTYELSEPATFGGGESPWRVEGDLYIEEGGKFRGRPGLLMIFDEGHGIVVDGGDLLLNGRIDPNEERDDNPERVVITTEQDLIGDEIVLEGENWAGITFQDLAGDAVIEGTVLNGIRALDEGCIQIDNRLGRQELSFETSILTDCEGVPLVDRGGNLGSMEYVNLSGSSFRGISVHPYSIPRVDNSNVYGNATHLGIFTDAVVVDADIEIRNLGMPWYVDGVLNIRNERATGAALRVRDSVVMEFASGGIAAATSNLSGELTMQGTTNFNRVQLRSYAGADWFGVHVGSRISQLKLNWMKIEGAGGVDGPLGQASVVLRGVDSDIAEVRNVEFEGSVGNDVDLDCDSTVYISDLSWSTGGGLVYNEECDL